VKLNEVKQVDEVNLSHVVGDYGAAGIKQIGNRLMGNAEGQLSVKDKMAKEKFIADFIGRANTNLNSAIKSGLVDPKMKAGTPQAQPTQTQQQPPANPTTPANTSPQANQNTPSPNATQATQPNTNAQQPNANAQSQPETPEQKRIRLQKAAQQNIDKQAVPFSKLPANQAQTQIANQRQQKQNAAAQTAQASMTPKVTPPANQATQKLTPQQQAAMKAKLQGQRQAGKTAGTTQSGFKNYVGGSGERIQGANPDGSPKVVKINRESKFYKLNALFESIIEAGEQPAQPAKQTISQYLQNMVTQYMKGRLRDPQSIAQVKAIADEVQNSYPSIKAPLTKLANLVFATSYSQGAGATATATAPATQTSPGFMAGLSKGLGATQGAEQSATQGTEQPAQASAVAQQPATTGTSAPTTAPATATPTASNAEKQTATTTTGAPAKEPTAYKQAIPLISKLDKKGKQRILKYIEKSLGIQSAPTQQEPETKAEPSAFGNMARQLDAMGNKNTSTGGELSSTGRGVKHTSSATNPNKAKDLDDKLNFANKQSTKSTKTRKAKTVGA
jgi:hypothetical protein